MQPFEDGNSGGGEGKQHWLFKKKGASDTLKPGDSSKMRIPKRTIFFPLRDN